MDRIITLVNILTQEEQIQRCVKSSMKGSAMAGGGAFMGGLMGGPVGLLAGGLVGTLFGFMSTRESFVSIPQAVNMLPEYRKERIASHVQTIIDELDVSDLAVLTSMAVAASNGGPAALAENILLRTIVQRSIEFIRNQVLEEQNANPQFLR